MSIVRYCVAMSIDGFIAAPDGSVDWLAPFSGDGGGFEEWVKGFGGLLMGRDSFEVEMSLHDWWYSNLPVAVMTHRPLTVQPIGVRCFSGAVAPALTWLKSKMVSGDIWLFGGGRVAGQCLEAGLVDALEIAVMPIVLGQGRRLFDMPSARTRLELVETATSPSGVQSLTYRAPRVVGAAAAP
jgi:dihydrofolate reductase